MGDIIEFDKTIVPACDVETLEQLKRVVYATREFPGVVAYKLGFVMGYSFGLPAAVGTIKDAYSEAVVIFDHQKACTDVPFTGEKFAKLMDDCEVDAAILFPRENDAVTQYAWTDELLERKIGVIVGGELTSRPATPDIERIYDNAVLQGVTNFVVPGNKPERVEHYRKRFEDFGIEADLFAPGFVSQGGDISEAGQVAGERWHAICGRAVYNPNKKNLDDVTEEEINESVAQLVSSLGD
ncbi:MAG: hypothetical protein ISS36_01435 [Candidatus Aenigmarchaeota archaeon]|nr:hypothetical protein [Candidatus Aenigmarchaeota archaeon]